MVRGLRARAPGADRTVCCTECWANLPKITGPKCESCALPMPPAPSLTAEEVRFPTSEISLPVLQQRSFAGRVVRGGLRVPGPDGARAARAEVSASRLSRPCARRVAEEALQRRGDVAFDVIAAVPMARPKERRRGYNQAELLARALHIASAPVVI